MKEAITFAVPWCNQLLVANKNRVVRIIWARTPKGLLHEVPTWSNMVDKMFAIVYDLIAMLTQTFTAYVWPTRLKAMKVTASNFLINVVIHLNRQKAGVFDWPLNYSNIRKSVWLEAWSCALRGASWLLVRHLKAVAWWEHWKGKCVPCVKHVLSRQLGENVAKLCICFKQHLVLLVVLFSLEQNQFALIACAD